MDDWLIEKLLALQENPHKSPENVYVYEFIHLETLGS